MKKALSLFLVMTLAAFAAETIKLNSQEIWFKAPPRVKFDENTISIDEKGRLTLFSAVVYDIDPFKSYTLSMTVKNSGTEEAFTLFGFMPLDADAKNISCASVRDNKGTLTELAADAKIGDDFIIIKNAVNWDIKANHCLVAFNAKLDYSDLPNTKLVANKPQLEKLEDGTYKVQLKAKLKEDYPAGTLVRQHYSGGYLYTAGAVRIKPGEEKVMKGTIKGLDAPGGFQARVWPVGTVKAKLVLYHDLNNKKCAVTYSNPILEIE